MVKGTTRQVIVVKGPREASFEQAIFLVREEITSKGGITEESLLREAQQTYQRTSSPQRATRVLWSLSGAALTGLIWLITSLL